MNPTLRLCRVYFFVVIWFTLWVGFFGAFRPEEILRALPWPVPPLHARFLGAFYLSAASFLLLSIFARTLREIRTILLMAFTWTGTLLLITVRHWETFDFSRPQPWFWVVAYVLFPLGAGGLALRARNLPAEGPRDRMGPAFRLGLRLQGALFLVVALACLFDPERVVAFWPWKISPFLAQVYSGPVVAYGVGGLALAARASLAEARIPAIGMAVFAGLGLAGSAQHLALFAAGSPSAISWFAVLSLLTLGAAALAVAATRARSLRP